MYLPPRSIFEQFLVLRKVTRLDERGRTVTEFKAAGELRGVITTTTASAYEREKFKGLKHESTHTIIQKLGEVKAQVGDMLVRADKKFLVMAIDNPGGIGQFFIYYVSERGDL